MVKNFSNKIVMGLLIFFVIGCGGGDNSVVSNKSNLSNKNTTYKISGRIIDGEIKNATIFLDLNLNGILDSNEPSTKSDESGYFNLEVNESNFNNFKAPIVSEKGFDIREAREFNETLMAFREQNSSSVVLTPVSTLIAADIIDNINSSANLRISSAEDLFSLLEKTKAKIAALFNLQKEILTKDPIELALEGNLELLKTNMKINKVAREIKKAIKKELRDAKKDAIRSYRALAKALKRSSKSGDEALEEAVDKIKEVMPEIFDKNLIPLVRKSTKYTLKSFNSYWQKSKDDIVSALKGKKKEFTKFNIDKTPPIITLNGNNPFEIELNSNYQDPGAVAIDDKDGLLDVKIIKNSVNTSEVGEYEVVYKAVDSSGNKAIAKRVVKVIAPKVVDTTPPTITIKGDNPFELEVNTTYKDPGAVAVDNVDGEVKVKIIKNSVNPNRLGEYEVIYQAVDSSGNEANATRVVRVVDRMPPQITLFGDNPLTINLNESFQEPGFSAIDNVDGNTTNKVKISGSVDTNQTGEYTLIYSVADSSGNEANATRVVKVIEPIDTTPPEITLLGANPQEIIIGNSYIELGAVVKDNVDENVTLEINSSNVRTDKFGEYKVIYKAVDSSGNEANVTRVVKVVSAEVLVRDFNVLEKRCGHFEDLRIENSYTLNNNDWGRDKLKEGQESSQCVFTFEENNTIKGGWFWGWPNGEGGVKGYPEAIYGKKFSRQVNLAGILPKKIKELKSVKINLEYRDFNITGRYNIALESWIHTTNNSSMSDIRYEIMIRFDPDGFHPGRRVLFEEDVEIGGVIYDVYKKRDSNDPNRYFYNFVAKSKITKIEFDFVDFLNYLKTHDSETCSGMDELYYNDVEMGVEVVNGSGVLVLDRYEVDVTPLKLFSESEAVIEKFVEWAGEFSSDTKIDTLQDINGTGLKWRSNVSNLIFRVKNHTLVQKQTKKDQSYLYTIFEDKSMKIEPDGAIVKEGSFNNNFDFKALIYDGDSWCISDNNFSGNYFSFKENSKWYRVEESDKLVSAFSDNSSLPTLHFNGECSVDFNNIKGFGIVYFYVDRGGNGYFKLDKLGLYSTLPKFAIYERDYKQDSVSSLLFGLCMTPNRSLSTSETFINNFKEWVTYLRWPGGSMIEDYDLRAHSSTTYSVGKWTAYIKDKIPNMEFLIGVSSTKAYNGDWNATEYGYGLVNYLNVDYNQSWGENEPLDKPLGLKFVEIGNEPDLEGLNAQKYGPVLRDYAKGINLADSSVKVLGPCTTHGQINNMLPAILKDYGDYIDIVSVHNYTDNPKDYKSDLEIINGHIQKYMQDNQRRAKNEIKIAFTEYNSLATTTRKGVYHEEAWSKVIWHSKTFSYFIQGGLYMSSLWHAYIGGGHATYKRDGTPYPIVSSLKFWKNHIDFTKHPKVLYSTYNDEDIIITAIEMDDKVAIFVVNGSPTEDKTISIDLINYSGADEVNITTLTHSLTGEFLDKKEVASNVDINKLQAVNPDVRITQDEDGKYYIEFPQINIFTTSNTLSVEDNKITHTFPKYSVSVIEYKKVH